MAKIIFLCIIHFAIGKFAIHVYAHTKRNDFSSQQLYASKLGVDGSNLLRAAFIA
jgi:hypothetical protein